MGVSTKNRNLLFVFLLLAAATIYFKGLFIDVTRDAAKYAYISKEIVETGNWLNLQIQGEPYNQKTHLMFWLSAISFLLWGISNFAFKLPVVLYSVLGIFATYKLGESLYGRKTGRMAAIILIFSAMMFLYNMDLHTDTVLQTNVALSLWLLYEYLKKGKLKYIIGAGLALGLAMMTKGPFGVLVPFFAVVGFLLSTRNFKRIFHWHWALMVAIAFVVMSPAIYNYLQQWGWQGIWFFVWGNNAGRISGSMAGNTPDPTFYIHNLLYLFAPWSLFFFVSAYRNMKDQIKKKLDKPGQFLFWGFWVFFILMSAFRSKLPNYIQCLLPIIAVLSAREWQFAFDREKPRKGFAAMQRSMVAIVVIGLLAVYFFIFSSFGKIYYAAVLLILPVVMWITKRWGIGERLWYSSLACAIAIGFSMNFYIMPMLFGQQAQPQAARVINENLKDGECVYCFDWGVMEGKEKQKERIASNATLASSLFAFEKHSYRNYELMFYSKHKVLSFDSFAQADSMLNSLPLWIYCDNKAYTYIVEKGIKTKSIAEFNHFDLRRSAKYINPKTRDKAIEKKYLIHLSNKE